MSVAAARAMGALASMTALCWGLAASAQTTTAPAMPLGPINADLPQGGDAYRRAIVATPVAAASWTLSAWVQPKTVQGKGTTMLIGGFGDPKAGPRRYLALVDGQPALVTEAGVVQGGGDADRNKWTHIAASYDGKVVRLFVNGRQVVQRGLSLEPVTGVATLAPRDYQPVFAGKVIDFRMVREVVDPLTLRLAARRAPDPAKLALQTGSPSWPYQTHQMQGQTVPQDAWTLPQSKAPIPTSGTAKPEPKDAALVSTATGQWAVNGWRLIEAAKVGPGGADLSQGNFDASKWYAATVPGTVLTTLVDRGVYPDPAVGLNNLSIPETLARQDYWYRTEFDTPAEAAGRQMWLTFNGVNYSAEVWVNGRMTGTMKGAFIRGRFPVTLAAGRNAIAVRVSPPPHPGIAHEESMTAGVGENGGVQMMDGPTFVATEGWDWIPSVRDRNTGLWQGVTLAATGPAVMGDPQVVTTLPKPDNSVADVEIAVPVTNNGQTSVTTTVRAVFDDVVVEKPVTVAPGQTVRAVLSPSEFPQLSVKNPRLWWPNGYGDPALHKLAITAAVDGALSDSKALRFGMRQVTYDLSLFDDEGDLERVTLDLNRVRGGPKVIDTSHKGIRKTANGWAMSFTPGGDQSAAVAKVTDDPRLAPYLTLRVNGVRIAARGGNIGMDDYRKRVDRAHLEPFFRLHRDAHLNIIRNWVGQNTEESFFDLADEYGLMVLSDFWESTQDYNMEAEDPQLFLANATDVVRRFRNHPSIVAWFGRNEGVPQPILNNGLDTLLRAEDGTRLYMPSSNAVNLQGSGPYNWRPPVEYFTTHAKGFSVEVGTPSLPTLESWKRTIPAEADRWPIGDVWAYHDWHQTGNGAVKSFTDALEKRFGAPTGLEDFERKAQMMEYESYRAIFEGMNAGLWTENSGRMLWMTQPAWPSSAWQIFSSDYDTHAAFYGVKKAAEPIHVQMNLPDHRVVLVNNTRDALKGVQVRVRVVGLDGRSEGEQEAKVVANAEGVTPALNLDLASAMKRGAVLVRLEATDAGGQVLSTNSYWQAADDAGYRALTTMGAATVTANTSLEGQGEETTANITLTNSGSVPAVETKLTVMNADGTQVLPAYFSDNYVTLLPGETRVIEIRFPSAKADKPTVAIRGWNVTATQAELRP
ncbi:LamG-like jellyroll fold domain-containing protein [uncultured Sphingomonas sp.]|uniref:glycosyl hydrolase 2 galactose-binding domain-containing protein n=1 Tax=uncultured Sphingomonas sp. TaxID=158754 RepID=UPI0025D77DA7|nr:LamG-like jellyroll fold domain-containing protein [uncultured Sphingomonas sp.]